MKKVDFDKPLIGYFLQNGDEIKQVELVKSLNKNTFKYLMIVTDYQEKESSYQVDDNGRDFQGLIRIKNVPHKKEIVMDIYINPSYKNKNIEITGASTLIDFLTECDCMLTKQTEKYSQKEKYKFTCEKIED